MALVWRHTTEGISREALAELYRVAPLGHKLPADLKVTFENSRTVRIVFEDGRMVGVGRVLADGVDCAYICDMAVHPSHQGTGLGKAILDELVSESRGHKKIILYAVPGKEGFYARAGFRRMTTAMAIFADSARAEVAGYLEPD